MLSYFTVFFVKTYTSNPASSQQHPVAQHILVLSHKNPIKIPVNNHLFEISIFIANYYWYNLLVTSFRHLIEITTKRAFLYTQALRLTYRKTLFYYISFRHSIAN